MFGKKPPTNEERRVHDIVTATEILKTRPTHPRSVPAFIREHAARDLHFVRSWRVYGINFPCADDRDVFAKYLFRLGFKDRTGSPCTAEDWRAPDSGHEVRPPWFKFMDDAKAGKFGLRYFAAGIEIF